MTDAQIPLHVHVSVYAPDVCRATGGKHDWSKTVDLFDGDGEVSGSSRACANCGLSRADHAMMTGE